MLFKPVSYLVIHKLLIDHRSRSKAEAKEAVSRIESRSCEEVSQGRPVGEVSAIAYVVVVVVIISVVVVVVVVVVVAI